MNSSLPETVRALVVAKDSTGKLSSNVEQLPLEALPPGDVTIRVAFSSLNYKDALASIAHPGVVKSLPHVPGIDAAGEVVASKSPRFPPGSQVIVTGFDLGSWRWGAYCDYIRVPVDWIVPLPDGLSLRDSMSYGTAGFTAAQSVAALAAHDVLPPTGEVVVTGASGGVGSIAVGILSRLGYRVAAVSGKPSARPMLESLGATEILRREEVDDRTTRPLLTARWSGAIDTVGGNILATLLRSVQPGGCVTACGLVGGADVPTTVYPFILRGVILCGIDSVLAPMSQRLDLWHRLAGPWRPTALESLVTEITLEDLSHYFQEILAGGIMGRVIVRI